MYRFNFFLWMFLFPVWGQATSAVFTWQAGAWDVSPSILSTQIGAETLGMRWEGLAVDGASVALPIVTHISQAKKGVQYTRGNLVEWYKDMPSGLEHGVTFLQSPKRGVKRLSLHYKLTGSLIWSYQGGVLTGRDSAGEDVAYYDSLVAFDSSSEELPSAMSFEQGRIAISVDVSDAVYPVVIDPFWKAAKEVEAPVEKGGQLGRAMQAHEEWLWVGAPGKNGGSCVSEGGTGADNLGCNQGAVYVYQYVNEDWQLKQTLVSPFAAQDDDFGHAVSGDGSWLVVGAPGRNTTYVSGDGGSTSVSEGGRLYFYKLDAGVWVYTQFLDYPFVLPGSRMGSVLSLDGNRVAVGLPNEPVAVGNTDTGEVTLVENVGRVFIANYDANNNVWAFDSLARLESSSRCRDDRFGFALSLQGDVLAVGRPNAELSCGADVFDRGAAHLFKFSAGSWSESKILSPPAELADESFGTSVLLSGNELFVGARFAAGPPAEPGKINSSGAVYHWTQDESVWALNYKLYPSDGVDLMSFGNSIAIDGNDLLIGAPGVEVDGQIGNGAAYLYSRKSSLDPWLPVQKIEENLGLQELLGWRVAWAKNKPVLSAYRAKKVDGVTDTGRVFNYASADNVGLLPMFINEQGLLSQGQTYNLLSAIQNYSPVDGVGAYSVEYDLGSMQWLSSQPAVCLEEGEGKVKCNFSSLPELGTQILSIQVAPKSGGLQYAAEISADLIYSGVLLNTLTKEERLQYRVNYLPSIEATTYSVDTGSVVDGQVIGSLRGNDSDTNTALQSYVVAGDDRIYFDIDPGTGDLRVKSAARLQESGRNKFELFATVSDGLDFSVPSKIVVNTVSPASSQSTTGGGGGAVMFVYVLLFWKKRSLGVRQLKLMYSG